MEPKGPKLSFLFWNLEFAELSGDIRSVRARLDFVIDQENAAVLSNVKGGACGVLSVARHDSVRLGRFPGWIAQNWVVEPQRFGELLVRLHVIATRRKIGHVELAQ